MNEENITLSALVDEIQSETDRKIENTRRFYEAGKRDCAAGIYDKWYRYNTYQDGRAYDIGWMEKNEMVKNETVKFLNP